MTVLLSFLLYSTTLIAFRPLSTPAGHGHASASQSSQTGGIQWSLSNTIFCPVLCIFAGIFAGTGQHLTYPYLTLLSYISTVHLTCVLSYYVLPCPYRFRYMGHRGRVHKGSSAALPRCAPYGRRCHFGDYDFLHFSCRHDKLLRIRYFTLTLTYFSSHIFLFRCC